MASSNVVPEWFSAIGTKRNYNTMVYYAGTGNNVFEINFVGGYINQSDVKAFMINDTTRENKPQSLTFQGTNTVLTYDNVPVGWTVCIYRDTPKSRPLSKFVDGAVINAYNLDRNAQQAVFSVAEMVDRFDSTTESVEMALKEVYEANQKSDQAINTANWANGKADTAINTANGAVTTANYAVGVANAASAKSDTAINTAGAATGTANTALAVAQGIDGKADQAINTANAANATANGINAKADQALATSGAADQKATQALNTANGIDGKATQALNTSNEAKATADLALNSIGTVKDLSERVESFGAGNGVAWKGAHVFPYIALNGPVWQDRVPSGSYKQEMLSLAPVGDVNYIRRMRAHTGAAIFHEIVEPDGITTFMGDNASNWVWCNKVYANGNLSVRGTLVATANVEAGGYYHTSGSHGAGSWNAQLNAQAPFNMNWGNTTNSSAYYPMIKSYRQNSNGYPTAVSFGHLAQGSSWGSAAIHVIGDGGKSASYLFNVDGAAYFPASVQSGRIIGNAGVSSGADFECTTGARFANNGDVKGSVWQQYAGAGDGWLSGAFYTLNTAHNATRDRANNTYTRTEVYTKYESDSRYMPAGTSTGPVGWTDIGSTVMAVYNGRGAAIESGTVVGGGMLSPIAIIQGSNTQYNNFNVGPGTLPGNWVLCGYLPLSAANQTYASNWRRVS